MVIVDRYSGWPSVAYLELGKANSKMLINTLREWFQVCEECAGGRVISSTDLIWKRIT